MNYPKITVGIVRGRDNDKWLNKAINSVSFQIYRSFAEIDLVVIENVDRKKTIGKCFNEIAQQSKGKWILYLGDDDHIVAEYLLSLIVRLNQTLEISRDKEIVNVISFTTKFDNKSKYTSSKSPTGMWLKEYVLNHPFDETLEKYVDTEMFNRLNLSNKYFPTVASHQYGYFYRQHDDNVSGNKIDKKDYDKKFNASIYKEQDVNNLLNHIIKGLNSVNPENRNISKNIIGILHKNGEIYSIKDLLDNF